MKIKILPVLISFLFTPIYWGYCQYPSSPAIPKPSSLTPGVRVGSSTPSTPAPAYPLYRKQQTGDYNPDEISRRNRAGQMAINEAIVYMKEQENTVRLARQLVDSGFPSLSGEEGTEYFHSAFELLRKMLCDSVPMDLGKAVFITENAFLGNTKDYRAFENSLQKRVDLCKWKLGELKKRKPDDFTKNAVLYSLMTDTFKVRQPGTERQIVHFPVQYNLDDYKSEKYYTSHFITTLLATNQGQCYSMPMLYMILAERLGIEAYLSFAPRHSFVKIRGHNDEWYNLELTCGYILSDYHYMNHNYIKTEAIRSGLYLSALDRKETLAYMLVQLGRYYLMKYGYDPFVLQCTGEAKKYMKVPLDALMLEADYETRLTLEVARLLNAPNPQVLKEKYPDAYRHYERMHEIYGRIDDTGYEDMPEEIYQRWLEHVEGEKEKERQHPRSPFIQIVK